MNLEASHSITKQCKTICHVLKLSLKNYLTNSASVIKISPVESTHDRPICLILKPSLKHCLTDSESAMKIHPAILYILYTVENK